MYQPFWDFHNGKISEEEWKARFERARKAANLALVNHKTVTVLAIILERTYPLRNQLIHGGATWKCPDWPFGMRKLYPLTLSSPFLDYLLQSGPIK